MESSERYFSEYLKKKIDTFFWGEFEGERNNTYFIWFFLVNDMHEKTILRFLLSLVFRPRRFCTDQNNWPKMIIIFLSQNMRNVLKPKKRPFPNIGLSDME